MKKHKITAALYYVAAILSYVSAIVNFEPKEENSLITQSGGTAFAVPPPYINTSLSHLG